MRAPKQMFWVELVTVGGLKFRQRGGGKFSSLAAAEDRQAQLAHCGIESEIYVSELEWKKVAG